MASETTRPSASEDCSTTTSFADHSIEDGDRLIRGTYDRLAEADEASFEPTESFIETLESAFVWAYLGAVDEPGVPARVEAAIDDAKVFTLEEFRDDPDADLRSEVLPKFYQHAAGFHCAYRD
jgi:predicted TPR repeat methyltransferase